jgi:hypothetical protein
MGRGWGHWLGSRLTGNAQTWQPCLCTAHMADTFVCIKPQSPNKKMQPLQHAARGSREHLAVSGGVPVDEELKEAKRGETRKHNKAGPSQALQPCETVDHAHPGGPRGMGATAWRLDGSAGSGGPLRFESGGRGCAARFIGVPVSLGPSAGRHEGCAPLDAVDCGTTPSSPGVQPPRLWRRILAPMRKKQERRKGMDSEKNECGATTSTSRGS